MVELSQIRGDLQLHTTASDGANSLEEMADKAIELGYEYLAVTDHSQNLSVAGGQSAQEYRQQFKKIDQLNQKKKNFTILKAAEIDVLKDGSLDLDDEILSEFDLVLCSIHSHFNLSEKEQTERVITAMKNPHFHIFSHPTGRIINARDVYKLDMEKVMKAALEYDCILEINAQPNRLDLDDIMAKRAKKMGIKISLGSDAHSTAELEYMKFGVDQAQRAWCEANDIINTYSLKELLDII